MSKVSALIDAKKPITLEAIEADLNDNDWECLYFATEEQIGQLIDEGRISEDFFSRHQDYQEEMRCLHHEAMQEFSS